MYYKHKNYSLPWNKKEFIQKVTAYQKKGILGIKTVNHKKAKERILNLHIHGAKIQEKDFILLIQTTANGTGDCRHIWKEITQSVKSILNREIH